MPFNVNSTNAKYYVCLSHSYDYCAGASTSISPDLIAILGEAEPAGWLVVVGLILIIIKNKTGSGDKLQVVGYYPDNAHGYPTNECLGAWGNDSGVHLGSCTSAHGIYWQFQCLDNPCYQWHLWNTYDKEYLIPHGGVMAQNPLQVHSPEPGQWETWSLYTQP